MTLCENQHLFNIDHQDLICPITKLYFRNPVIASDGHVYEENAIAQWLEKNQTSPMTREKIDYKIFPCNIIKNLIDSVDQSKQFFYMQRYQFGIKDWIHYYVKKFSVELNDLQSHIIHNISNNISASIAFMLSDVGSHHKISTFDCEFTDILIFTKISDYLAKHVNINMCKMPDRKILYDLVVGHIAN